jgi:hypothetical protein
MFSRTKWTSHKGEKILYVDFSGLKDDQLVETANEAMNLLNGAVAQGDPYFLVLMNVSRLKIQDQLPDEFANLAVLRANTTIFTAILGIQGIPKNLVNLLLPDIELVDTITEGKDWLVKEANRL